MKPLHYPIEGPTEQERQEFDKAAEIEAQTPITVGATNEELALKFRQQLLAGDGKPEGTRESLKRCATILNTYAPELFPANEQGQVHFARAMMESVADEIIAYLSTPPAASNWAGGAAMTPSELDTMLAYIADSPPREYGGFHQNVIDTAKAAIAELLRLRERVRELEANPFVKATFPSACDETDYIRRNCIPAEEQP